MWLNQIDNQTGFYEYWSVESDIRTITFNFPNAYQVAFLDAGRGQWKSTYSHGCFESLEAAQSYYDGLKQAEEMGEAPVTAEAEDEKTLKQI